MDVTPQLAAVLFPVASVGLIGLWTAVIRRLAPADWPAPLPLLIAGIALYAAQYALGLGLLLVGAFRPEAAWLAVAAAVLVPAVILLRLGPGRAAAGPAALEFTRPERLMVVAAALVILASVIRSGLMPPIDWDFLTYHGPRAAFWASDGTLFGAYDAPGRWQHYRAFQIAGTLPNAWSMLLTGGDWGVAAIGLMAWVAIGVAGYPLARELGARPAAAVLAALAILTIPACFHHRSSGYADNLVTAAVVTSAAVFVAAERRGSLALAGWGIAAAALAFATKWTALPMAGMAGLVWLWMLWRHGAETRPGSALGAGVAIGAIALAWPAVLAARYGNPVFPFAIPPIGVEGYDGPLREWRGGVPPPMSIPRAAFALTFDGFCRSRMLHNGVGPGGLAALGAGALALLAGRRLRSPALLAMLAASLVLLLMVLATRVRPPGLDEARYATVPVILMLAALAAHGTAAARAALMAVLALNLVYALPWRWAAIDAAPVGLCLGVVAVLWAVLRIAGPGRRSPLGSAVAACAAGFLLAAALMPVGRGAYLTAAAEGRLFNSGPIAHAETNWAHPIWAWLAERPGLRIAVSAGTKPAPGHWLIYPLFGAHLQHEVIHLRTGLYYPEERAAASPEALAAAGERWVAELTAAGADLVLLYRPDPVEAQWVTARPELFRPVLESVDGGSVLYAVGHAMAAAEPAPAGGPLAGLAAGRPICGTGTPHPSLLGP